MTLSEAVARFVVQADPSALDSTARVGVTQAISDCVGCMLAGASTDVGRIVRKVTTASAARGAARAVGSAERTAPQAAALINGAAGHSQDYDDVGWTLYGHPSVAVLPAALAVADAVDARRRDLVFAYALGVEVASKLARWANPAHYEHGWHSTATLGVFGATAAACRLYGLDEAQTAMAMGIAASEACGLRRNFGSMTKPYHAGNAARAGVLAAELAREGLTADRSALEATYGWFATLQARAIPSAIELQAVLGRPWEVADPGIVLKRYPSCGCTHCALDAIVALRSEHGFRANDVERIDCFSHPLAKKVLIHPRPRTGLEGKFSMEFCMAVAAVEGAPGVGHFTDAWVSEPRVEALIRRVAFTTRDDLAVLPAADAVPAEVVVHLRDGRIVSRKVTVPAGDPRNPMGADERRVKFVQCAAALLGDAGADRLWQRLEGLDGETSVRALTEFLGVPASNAIR
jgi:2-methylcitrate dehydratase PrpD